MRQALSSPANGAASQRQALKLSKSSKDLTVDESLAKPKLEPDKQLRQKTEEEPAKKKEEAASAKAANGAGARPRVGDVTGMTKYAITSWVKNTNSFRNLLNTSKGRDKCAQFIQYCSSFYIACMRTSDDAEIHRLVNAKKEPTVNRAKKLENNISNGRKIFRLLLWLNEISEIENLINNKKMNKVLRLLKICSTCCSFLYYIADNSVWLAGMGFTDPKIFSYKWKQIKNTFSLAKTVLELIISAYTIHMKTQQEKQIRERLKSFKKNTVELDTEQYALVR